MHPSQVLDKKADLVARSMQEKFKDVIQHQIRLDTRSVVKADGSEVNVERSVHGADVLATYMGREMGRSHAYYVAPDMTDLIIWASAKLDDSDQFRVDELPTEYGFAYFDKPLPIIDVRGKTMLANVVCWFPATAKRPSGIYPVTAIVYFNDARHTPDQIAKEIEAASIDVDHIMGGWGMIGMQAISDGARLGPSLLSTASEEIIAEMEKDGASPHEFTNILRMLHAYWLLLNQTVIRLSDAEIPRAMSKRARRMDIPDRVTIVALRRIEGHTHGESDVDWQYRWLVRGHWRWQHVSKDHPLAEPDPEGGFRARVWVRPHVKGPEDKPFHLTEKVYSLVR